MPGLEGVARGGRHAQRHAVLGLVRASLSSHGYDQVCGAMLLNEHLGESFFDYINRRRVAEVQRCLADPAYRGETVLAIATAAGFNSKASFNAVFLQRTGQTPSEYRRSVSDG